jgi:hypothetical protein
LSRFLVRAAISWGTTGPIPLSQAKIGKGTKKIDQTLLEESQSVVWLLCELLQALHQSKTKRTATATKPTKRKTRKAHRKPCIQVSSFAKLRPALSQTMRRFVFVQITKVSRCKPCTAHLCVFSATPKNPVAFETWLNRNRYLIVAAFQGISAKQEVNKKDPKQNKNLKLLKRSFR